MYTAVLMMALSGGSEVVDFRHSCRRCSGCCCSSYCGGYYCSGGGCCISGGGYYYGVPGRQMPKKEMPKKENLPTPKKTEAQAYLIVNLPAQARLLVDDQPTSSTSTLRQLQTPPLTYGSTYTYVLRAEIDRNGQTLTQTQRVVVRPGAQTRVSFDFAGRSVAEAPRD
jgi:uncharacterized protein (TIGR03000 family)